MKAILYRGLLAILVGVLGGSALTGCDEGSEWEHPNRERHPAPPSKELTTRSVEELQRDWREQDRRRAQQEGQYQRGWSSPGELTADKEQARDALDNATHYLREALEAAASNAQPVAAPQEVESSIGGGPADEPASRDAQPTEQESGEM